MMRLLGATDLDVLEALLEQHPGSPFFVKDSQLRYVAANKAMAKLCGLSVGSDLFGRRAGDLFGEELGLHYEALDRMVIETGRSLTNFFEPTRSRSGSQAWLLFTRVPIRDAAGAAVGVAANAYQLPGGEPAERCYIRLRAAIELLRKDFAEQVSMRQIAARIGTSVTQLERDFRRVFDTTPSAYLDSLRLEHAKALLADPGLSVAQIAYACGYADQSAFSRRFLKQVGTTPTGYRRLPTASSSVR
jgi:PAS domain S-box-containing protein